MKSWKGVIVLGTLAGIAGTLVRFALGSIPEGGEITALNDDHEPKLVPVGEELTVLSWNIHYGGGSTLEVGRGQTRSEVIGHLDAIAAFIRSTNPDIVALQEVDRGALRSHDIDQVEWLQNATDLNYAAWTPTWDAGWVPHPGLNPTKHIGRVRSGQVILSRFPLSRDRHIRLPQPPQTMPLYNRFYLHRHLTDVQAQVNETTSIRIVNAHLEAFHAANRQRHAATAVDTIGGETAHTILLGDMNCVPPEARLRSAFPDEPDTDMSTDPTIGMLRDIDGMQEVVPTSVYAAAESDWFTFPASAPNRRLDYIFHGDRLVLISAEVPALPNPPSDHLPVVARFSVR